jgi:hypothetical protein
MLGTDRTPARSAALENNPGFLMLDDDDEHKLVWPSWAVGVLSGVQEFETIPSRTHVTDNNGYFINILLIFYVTYFIHILFIFY